MHGIYLCIYLFTSFIFSLRFEYDLPVEEIKFKSLSVTVKNNSASFRSRDVIGQVSLKLVFNLPLQERTVLVHMDLLHTETF